MRKKVECDQCGETKECTFTVNPFDWEMSGPEGLEESWWCDNCWIETHDDI